MFKSITKCHGFFFEGSMQPFLSTTAEACSRFVVKALFPQRSMLRLKIISFITAYINIYAYYTISPE